MLFTYLVVEYHLFCDGGVDIQIALLIYLWQEVGLKYLIFRWPLNPVDLLLIKKINHQYLLFVWLVVVFPTTWEFFTHMKTSPLPMKAANFDLCSELFVFEQWGFVSVPHVLWHGASVYNGHLRGPVTLTPIGAVNTWFYD